jgi:hypothetical protein
MTTATVTATDARPDPNNDIPTIVVPDGTCLATNDGDTSYAEAIRGQATGSLALVGGAVFWTPASPVRWTRIDSAQMVVVARYVSGSDVRLQAGWTDPAFLTNTRAYGAFTGPALTAGYATYTATIGTGGDARDRRAGPQRHRLLRRRRRPGRGQRPVHLRGAHRHRCHGRRRCAAAADPRRCPATTGAGDRPPTTDNQQSPVVSTFAITRAWSVSSAAIERGL